MGSASGTFPRVRDDDIYNLKRKTQRENSVFAQLSYFSRKKTEILGALNVTVRSVTGPYYGLAGGSLRNHHIYENFEKIT